MIRKVTNKHSSFAISIASLLISAGIQACGNSTQGNNGNSGGGVQNNAELCGASEKEVCGPFSEELIQLCKKSDGGMACESNQWSKKLYDRLSQSLPHSQNGESRKPAADDNPNSTDKELAGQGDFGAKFVQSYLNSYETIAQFVGFTTNACARYVSEALYRNGVKVDRYEAWAQKVSSQLRDLGWTKITDRKALKPGDVIFTADASTFVDGQSPHVFVFVKYDSNLNDSIALDNQGNSYVRNLDDGGPKTPFWYAYRKP